MTAGQVIGQTSEPAEWIAECIAIGRACSANLGAAQAQLTPVVRIILKRQETLFRAKAGQPQR